MHEITIFYTRLHLEYIVKNVKLLYQKPRQSVHQPNNRYDNILAVLAF